MRKLSHEWITASLGQRDNTELKVVANGYYNLHHRARVTFWVSVSDRPNLLMEFETENNFRQISLGGCAIRCVFEFGFDSIEYVEDRSETACTKCLKSIRRSGFQHEASVSNDKLWVSVARSFRQFLDVSGGARVEYCMWQSLWVSSWVKTLAHVDIEWQHATNLPCRGRALAVLLEIEMNDRSRKMPDRSMYGPNSTISQGSRSEWNALTARQTLKFISVVVPRV